MAMTAKRRNKLRKLAEEIPVPEIHGDHKGTLMVGWGSTYGPIHDAVTLARHQGEKVRGVAHRRGAVLRPLAALLLPPARRPEHADDLRRREPARRQVVRHPPGDRAAARPADLRADAQLPQGRAGPRPRGADARRPAPEDARPVGQPRARRGARRPVGRRRDPRRRHLRRRHLEPDPDHPGRQRVWLRVSSPLPDDPFWHTAAFTYLSDMTLMGAALSAARPQLRAGRRVRRLARPHGLVPPAVPRRRVVALRPGLAGGVRRPWAGAGAGLHPGRHAGRLGRAGGRDPAAEGRADEPDRGARRPARPRGSSTSTCSAASSRRRSGRACTAARSPRRR